MIKKWKDFIKESKQLNLFRDTEWDIDEPEIVYLDLYTINEEDLSDYLLEIEEAGYSIDIQFGFTDDKGSFHQEINNYKVKTSIGVTITYNNPNHEDVTSCLRSTINKMRRIYPNISIHDNSSKLDIKDLIIKNGIFIKTEEPEPNDLLEIDGALFILFKSDKETQLTDEIICKYYKFKDDITYDDKGNAGVAIPRNRLSDLVLSSKSSFKDIIDSDEYDYPDDYNFSDFIPEHDSFFHYYLDNDNIRLMLEYCFKDWDNLKEQYSDKDDTIFDNYSDKEDLISSVIKPKDIGRYGDRNQVGSFLHETEIGDNIYDELRRLYAEYEISAKSDDDYEQIFEAFDKSVEDNLDTKIISKFTKEETKRVKRGDVYVENSYHRNYYRIRFNLNWLCYSDAEQRFNSEIDDSIYSWDPHRTHLEPHFNDYASVDWKEYNIDAKSMIQKFINSNNS